MTAVCSGNPSVAKPAFAASVFIGPAAIGGLLNNIPTPWAVGLGALIGGVTYELTTFCTSDPPAVPTLTAADALALLNPIDPKAKSDAVLKVEQLIGAYAWYQLCDCTVVATPSPPSAPSKPTGWPDINPPQFPGVVTTPCKSVLLGPGTVTGTQSFSRSGLNSLGLVPTYVRFTCTNAVVSGGGVSIQFDLKQQTRTSPLTTLVTDSRTLGPGTTQAFSIPVKTDAFNFIVDVTGLGGAGVSNDSCLIELFCNGDVPGGAQTPCCPPDLSLAQQVKSILDTVTLIQRQIVPFAYVPGPVHTALSGTGSFTIANPIIGLKIDLTTIPNYIGDLAGTPDRIFDVGFVSVGDLDGYWFNRRLAMPKTVWFPKAAGAITKIGYTLQPNVIASITELVREP